MTSLVFVSKHLRMSRGMQGFSKSLKIIAYNDTGHKSIEILTQITSQFHSAKNNKLASELRIARILHIS